MPTITITWDATLDERTCPICRALHGHTWIYAVTQKPIPDELVHPQYGVVWNKTVGSQAHGHERFNCRCTIPYRIDVSDLKPRIEAIKTDLEARVAEQSR
jgi:hypothetical protein